MTVFEADWVRTRPPMDRKLSCLAVLCMGAAGKHRKCRYQLLESKDASEMNELFHEIRSRFWDGRRWVDKLWFRIGGGGKRS